MGLMRPLVGVMPQAGAAATPVLQGSGSIGEAWLTGAGAGDSITLLQNSPPVANTANSGAADALGSLIIRNLTPGSGYTWDDTTAGTTTLMFSVLAPDANPATDFAMYSDQPMHAGLNCITMRDGIQLVATVRYPYDSTCSTAALGEPCTGCGDQNLLPDSATDIGSVLARVSGFATVSLQMRGTRCSGGAYDLFGYPSDYDASDASDAVVIVAHQDWVANHKVGMVGTSYSGLFQLPAAGTDPTEMTADGAGSMCLANQALHGQSESLSSLVGPQMVAPGTGPGPCIDWWNWPTRRCSIGGR
jgi:hypothetical protein